MGDSDCVGASLGRNRKGLCSMCAQALSSIQFEGSLAQNACDIGGDCVHRAQTVDALEVAFGMVVAEQR